MPKQMRQQQHRPEAEEKKRNKLLAEVKSENQHLRKQIARLQKRIEKLMQSPVIEEIDPEPAIKLPPLVGCVSCKAIGSITEFKIPSGTILQTCTSCGHRTRK